MSYRKRLELAIARKCNMCRRSCLDAIRRRGRYKVVRWRSYFDRSVLYLDLPTEYVPPLSMKCVVVFTTEKP